MFAGEHVRVPTDETFDNPPERIAAMKLTMISGANERLGR